MSTIEHIGKNLLDTFDKWQVLHTSPSTLEDSSSKYAFHHKVSLYPIVSTYCGIFRIFASIIFTALAPVFMVAEATVKWMHDAKDINAEYTIELLSQVPNQIKRGFIELVPIIGNLAIAKLDYEMYNIDQSFERHH